MSREMSMLEGSYRLTTITKAKRLVYVIQVITLVVMSFIFLLMGGLSLKPFYMPIDALSYFVVVMLLVLKIEAFLFRLLEVKFTKSNSRKFLMVKNTIKKSIVTMVVFVIVAVILLLPFTGQAIEDSLGHGGEITPANQLDVRTRDPLGLTSLTRITVMAPNRQPVYDCSVYLLNETLYESYRATYDKTSESAQMILNSGLRRSFEGRDEVTFTTFPSTNDIYHVVMVSGNLGPESLQVVVIASGAPTFFTLVPILLLAIAGVSAGVIAYMTPMKKVFSEGSIYT
ncbi:MAG: hypothetical protein QCI38_06875 [Candidatus Thermoplasmatota archaeon]|nr:hypothetical protein [Candidatus Thermoplasmatota archaeon]